VPSLPQVHPFLHPTEKALPFDCLMADEIPYWEYIFLTEDDCGSDGFKAEHDDNFWADKDGNEFLC
jgi:hypothetical protein